MKRTMGNLYSGALQTIVSALPLLTYSKRTLRCGSRNALFSLRHSEITCMLSLCAVLMLSACSNQPQPVNFTIYPKKTTYPDGQYEQEGEEYKPKVIPSTAYYNRGDPENLMDVSVEVVNIPLYSASGLHELNNLVAQDAPARAELGCNLADSYCKQAHNTLGKHGVPVRFDSNHDGVTLYYERVMARDCENRFVENKNEKHSLPAPTFGCSVTANTVQQVSDKRQFSNPHLLDFQDGQKSVQNVERYQKPPVPSEGRNNSLLQQIPIGGSGR
jgi:hypothetical protein